MYFAVGKSRENAAFGLDHPFREGQSAATNKTITWNQYVYFAVGKFRENATFGLDRISGYPPLVCIVLRV